VHEPRQSYLWGLLALRGSELANWTTTHLKASERIRARATLETLHLPE